VKPCLWPRFHDTFGIAIRKTCNISTCSFLPKAVFEAQHEYVSGETDVTKKTLWLFSLPALCLSLTLVSAYAHAQTARVASSHTDATAAIDDRGTGQSAKPEQHELKADGLTGTVTVLRTGRPFPAGGSAFAQIKVANTAKKKSADAELVFSAETADLVDISGDKVETQKDSNGGQRIARLKKIRKGRPRSVIVELKLREPDPGASKEPQNKLKITLRNPGGTGETTTLGWQVTNCAGGFYSEIVKVREGSGSGISEAIKASQSRDRARPGRWLFPPRLKRSTAGRKCIRRARRWSSSRGRYVYRCTRYKTIRPAIASAATPVESEGRIFRFAARFVSARAVDRELDQRRDAGWATRRVSQNLKAFLKQDQHPAICTGAIQFFNYFDQRMESFAKRAETFDDMAGKSWGLAVLRTGEAIEAAKSQEGGHPGWGAAPLDLSRSQEGTSLKSLTESLAQITNDAELSQKVAEAGDAFDALRDMSAYFRSKAAKSMDKSTRAAMYRALSAIEAADYIGAVALHYVELRHALIGSMKTLRQAHGRSCTCDG